MLNGDNRLILEIDRLAPDLLAISHDISLNPELGNEEFYAQQRLTEFLGGLGWSIEKGVGGLGTSFTAFRGSRRGPSVGFMAEYDALPELGHACGHNLISAASVGAAVALSRVLNSGSGLIKVFGTPAEETTGGKIALLNEGIFDGLDAVMMFHPGIYNAINFKSLALEALEVTFLGSEGHTAVLSDSRGDTLEAILQFFNCIKSWRNSLSPSRQIHGIIREGGIIPNVRPARTVGRFYLRAPEEIELASMIEIFNNQADEAAKNTGTTAVVTAFENRYKPFRTNETLAKVLLQSLKHLNTDCSGKRYQGLGSMDMGNVSQQIPAIHPYLTVDGAPRMLHTLDFAHAARGEWGDRLILLAAKALALTAYQVMTKERLRKKIWAEHLKDQAVEGAAAGK